jgi:predicted permease
MTSFFQDLRLGFRLLVRQRGFAAVAVIVLAFGIGANTAVFTLVNALVLKPRPGVPDHELAGVYSRDRTQPDAYRAFSWPNYVDLRSRSDLFASVTAHTFTLVGLTEGDKTRRVFVDVSTGNFFDTFGVKLALGRTFTAEEERPGADIPVTILSYGAWQRLGGTVDVLNRPVKLNGRTFEVIGVAPRGFGGSLVLVTPELWLPTGVYDTMASDAVSEYVREGSAGTLRDRRHHALILVARLRPGASIESTTPALQAIGGQLEQAYPGENQHQELSLAPLARLSVGTSPQTDGELGVLALLLFSMSGLVLLVASLNLANMLLARGSARRKEFAVRLALGGNRSRIVRQLLTESVSLSLAGGALATFVAWWATRLLVNSLSPMLPIVIELDTTPDLRILLATVAFCLVSALFFGLGPAWRHARTDALPELREQAGEAVDRRRGRLTTRHVLVMGQLALSLVTLTAAGLFVRAALENAKADPGFTFERGIMTNVDPSLGGRNRDQTRSFYQRALAGLRELPGVESASFGSIMAFGEFTESRSVQKAGAPIRRSADGSASMSLGGGPGGESVDGLVDAVSTFIGADYFRTIGLTILAGREFSAAEEFGPTDARVAIIDETLARGLFGQSNPVGEMVQYSQRRGAEIVQVRVVGVVAPSRHQLLERAPRAHIYTPYGQDFRSAMFLHVRTAAPTPDAEAAMLPGIRRELLAIDPDVPVLTLETRPMYRDRNFELWMLGAGANMFLTFGALALFMSVVGVYGVKAYIVARRTREIGIRVALGATGGDVTRLVIRDGVLLAAAGVVLGLGLSAVAGSAIRSLLFRDTRFDAPVVIGAAVVLTAAALLASWLPARRAMRIAPTIALRSE